MREEVNALYESLGLLRIIYSASEITDDGAVIVKTKDQFLGDVLRCCGRIERVIASALQESSDA